LFPLTKITPQEDKINMAAFLGEWGIMCCSGLIVVYSNSLPCPSLYSISNSARIIRAGGSTLNFSNIIGEHLGVSISAAST